MNREQRRSAARRTLLPTEAANLARAGDRLFGGTASLREEVITTNFGHDGHRVCLQFSKPVPNMFLTVEKAEEWCRNIQAVIAAIRARPLNPGTQPLPEKPSGG